MANDVGGSAAKVGTRKKDGTRNKAGTRNRAGTRKKAGTQKPAGSKPSGPRKMKAYASFADWRNDQSARHRTLIDALAVVVEKTVPRFERFVKWGQGCWVLDGVPKVFIHAAPDHVQFGFYAGSTLADPQGLLTGSGQYVRHVKVFAPEDIRPGPFAALVRQVKQKR